MGNQLGSKCLNTTVCGGQCTLKPWQHSLCLLGQSSSKRLQGGMSKCHGSRWSVPHGWTFLWVNWALAVAFVGMSQLEKCSPLIGGEVTSGGYHPLCARYLHSFIDLDVFLHREPATLLLCRASAGVLSGPQMPELWNSVLLLDIGWFKHPKVIILNDFLEFWSSSYSKGVSSTTWARVSQPLVSYEAFLLNTRLDYRHVELKRD